jgi:hypothetical protein
MATSSLIDSNYALITQSRRMISNLIPDVVIEEIATDTLRVTDHPTEMGAAVSDHAFLLPQEIVMRCGWSNSNGHGASYVALQYWFLLSLQARREPFMVITAHRVYSNMLIAFVHKTADEKIAKDATLISVGMRQVIITDTSLTPSMAQTGMAMIQPSSSAPAFTTVDPTASGALNPPLGFATELAL